MTSQPAEPRIPVTGAASPPGFPDHPGLDWDEIRAAAERAHTAELEEAFPEITIWM